MSGPRPLTTVYEVITDDGTLVCRRVVDDGANTDVLALARRHGAVVTVTPVLHDFRGGTTAPARQHGVRRLLRAVGRRVTGVMRYATGQDLADQWRADRDALVTQLGAEHLEHVLAEVYGPRGYV